MKTVKMFIVALVLGLIPLQLFSWQGMPTPPLHVEGRFLKDPSGKNVLLHGWMQPTETWFNGGGNRYSNPTDWNNTANVAGMLNFMRDAATVMSDTSPKYGRSHGWYATFVRVNCDARRLDAGEWTGQRQPIQRLDPELRRSLRQPSQIAWPLPGALRDGADEHTQ